MAKKNTRHDFNLALFDGYLKDQRTSLVFAFISFVFIALVTYRESNLSLVLMWLLGALSIYLIKHLASKNFKLTLDENEFTRFEKRHHFIQAACGLAWGSVCFLLLPSGQLSTSSMLVVFFLSVTVAYSASIMSASNTGMLAFVTPIIACLLFYFAIDFAQHQWWFIAIMMLGVTSVIFSQRNHQHTQEQIESKLLNERYIEEINKFKASVQKANMALVSKNEMLITTQNRLEMLATNDELTQVYNRRYAMSYLDKLFAELKRHHENFVLVLADIDHFKTINDRFGHPAGDEVLKGFSRLIKQQLRQVDTVARYGGEEFLIMLPKTNELEARTLIQRLCNMVAEHPYKFDSTESDQTSVKVTSSFGLATFEIGDTVEKLIERADKALYHAKKSGRNNVKTYEDVEMAQNISAVRF